MKGSPSRTKAWGEICLAAYLAHSIPPGIEPGLEATTFFDPANFVYPFGTHIAVVEVDAGTGEVSLTRYIAVGSSRANPSKTGHTSRSPIDIVH